jgi:hypothetical protein
MIEKYFEIKSIDPKLWGKQGWIFLNCIALTYKPEFKNNYKLFFEQLPYILPCITCGKNLKSNINDVDNALKSKESLLKWLITIRNGVYDDNNESYKKKSMKETFNEIFEQNQDNRYIYIIMSIIIMLVLIFVFKYEFNKRNVS